MNGKALIFSAPSGSGKTTIVRHLLSCEELRLRFSISATTRAPRGHEVDGDDYYFLGVQEFLSKIEAGEFVEWEEVYPGQYYGTLRQELERIWSEGNNAVFDVDVVGGLELKKAFGSDALAIFVSPPDLGVLEQRLRGRGTESEDKLTSRLAKAQQEMGYAERFDRIITNNELEAAFQEAEALVSEFIAT